MNNPFENLPLNTLKSYVGAKTNCGCEVFIPVDSRNPEKMVEKKKELNEFLRSRNDHPPKILA